jgi:exodeoxyribonuclease VIII
LDERKNNAITFVWALEDFCTWVKTFNDDNLRVWGNGANFDNVILRNALDRYGYSALWKYSNDRCFRTMKNILPKIEATRAGTYHNALDDAIYQVNYLQMAVAKVL